MKRPTEDRRGALIAALGEQIVRFQDATNAVDDAAAAVLALSRAELQCVSFLLFSGPMSAARLAEGLKVTPRALRPCLDRIEFAGYARRVVAPGGEQVELTDHARRWVETLWGPIGAEGARLLARQSTRDLEVFARFMEAIGPIQEAHAARIRALLEAPSKHARSGGKRGGLSGAALHRVRLFVEANLERSLPLAALAERAGLSAFHFAREFKATTGTTPRAFVEARRVERAQRLLRGTTTPLGQIAGEVGLGTQSRFTTTFRRVTGLTPGAYRKGARLRS